MMAISSLQVVTGYYNSLGTPAINTAVTAQLGAGWIPHGAPVLTDVYGQVAQVMVKSPGLTTTAYSIATGANPMAADATWDALGDPLWIESTQYLQAYTKGAQVTSLINLTNQVSGILPIANGGTNANNIASARANLQAFLESSTQLSGNLNNYNAPRSGLHMQSTNAGATTANNYPVNLAGTLLVIANGADGGTSCRQFYYPYNSDDVYSRWFSPVGSIWSSWSRTSYANGITPITNGGTGADNPADARTNLQLNRFQQPGVETWVVSQDGLSRFIVKNSTGGDRLWGLYDGGGGWRPLGIGQGGTGATTAVNARSNLGIGTVGTLNIVNLATNVTGTLPVANGGTGATNATTARDNLGLGAASTVTFGGFDVDGAYGINANGRNNVTGSSITSRYYDASNTLKGQGEFRVDGNGTVTFVNRVPGGSTSFWNMETDGRFTSPQGYTTYNSLDWNATQNITNRCLPMSGSTNAPSAFTFGGIHVGFGVHATQYAGRNNSFYARSQEGGSWQAWREAVMLRQPINFTGGNWNGTNDSVVSCFINGTSASNHAGIAYGNLLDLRTNGVDDGANGAYRTQMAFSKEPPYTIRVRNRNDGSQVWSTWRTVWQIGNTNYTGNTTVDANGFIKIASPVIILRGDGSAELNDESEGAVTERAAAGVYSITGVLGFNSDDTWHVEVPKDVNGQPLIWVDYSVKADGSIEVRTYHREHPNAPVFARNTIDGYADGDAIDIPQGKSLTLRVNMPDL